jgi:PAS domain-containing protein
MMSAIAQLRPNSHGSPGPALFRATVQAFPESLAIVKAGVIVYANPAWCGMFECPDPSQLQGLPVEDLIPAHSLSVKPAAVLNQAASNQEDERDIPAAHFVHTQSSG